VVFTLAVVAVLLDKQQAVKVAQVDQVAAVMVVFKELQTLLQVQETQAVVVAAVTMLRLVDLAVQVLLLLDTQYKGEGK
jgi:hypothetical protein